MKIDRIAYQKVFPIGNYATERIGLEASIDDVENPETALNHLKIMVNELHAATMVEIEQYKGTVTMVADNPTIPNVQVDKEPPTPLTKEEKQKKYITDTTTIEGADGLKSFALLVSKNPHLQQTYDNHMELLQSLKNK